MPYVANDPTASRIPVPGPGRTPAIANAEEMESRAENYFELRLQEGKPFTLSGLSLYLGLNDWRHLWKYGQNPAFSDVVSRLKARVLDQAENATYNPATSAGGKFHASILGMNEKTIVETQNLNVNVAPPMVANLENLSNDQLARIADAVRTIADLGANRSGTGSPVEKQDPILLPDDGPAAAGTVPEAP